MTIVFHIADEAERFQRRLRVLRLDDVAAILVRNKTRDAYGHTENTISLVFPGS